MNNRSFSGTDTLVFAIFPNTQPIVLGSITTLSYSSYRVKNPVNTIGQIATKGVSKAGRTIAGSMVFMLINQHWIREFMDTTSWLRKLTGGTIYSDELPLFDIMIVSASEYGNFISMMITGVSFTDEAQVISINDMFIENTFSFIARDIKSFSQKDILEKGYIDYKSNHEFTKSYVSIFDNEEPEEERGNGTVNRPLEEEEEIHDSLNRSEITTDTFYNHLSRLTNLDLETVSSDNVAETRAISIKEAMSSPLDSVDYFVKNVLFDVSEEAVESIGENKLKKDTVFYSSKEMKEENHRLESGESVNPVAFDGNYIFTTNGWIYREDIVNDDKYNKLIGEAYIGEKNINKYKSINGIYIIDETTEDFLNNFYINVNSTNESRMISNIQTKTGGKYKNSIVEEVVLGETSIRYSGRDFEKASELKIILKSLDSDNFAVYTVKTKG